MFEKTINQELSKIRESGLYKDERIINSPQDSLISVNNNHVLNFEAD